jgi:hypothetical protein
MLVFRKSQERLSGAELLNELRGRLAAATLNRGVDEVRTALIRLGELECALEDAEHPSAPVARALTDAIAAIFVGDERTSHLKQLEQSLGELILPAEVVLRRPEGYAYYALDPEDYARLAWDVEPKPALTVVGIRSIGTSLSAVVAAVFRRRRSAVRRLTVRPTGDPWNRVVKPGQPAERAIAAGAQGDFVIVDEGPGLSGSSFLSVADALLEHGILRDRILMLCSRSPDPERLVGSNAAQRWRRLQSLDTRPRSRAPGAVDISAGRWRYYTHGTHENFPASWFERERLKYLYLDRGELSKFAGFAPYGERSTATLSLLADAGYAPRVFAYQDGFVRQEWCRARYFPTVGAVAPVDRIAEYLAFRVQHFSAPSATTSGLEEMLRLNVAEVFGLELGPEATLKLERPVYCDSRMQPHEWLLVKQRILKCDAGDHGDDHLFPGPCDIAWDLAGAIIEWELDFDATERLLARYGEATGDSVRLRLGPYLAAYASFRVGCMRMGLLSANEEEEPRLRHMEQRYVRQLAGYVDPERSRELHLGAPVPAFRASR